MKQPVPCSAPALPLLRSPVSHETARPTSSVLLSAEPAGCTAAHPPTSSLNAPVRQLSGALFLRSLPVHLTMILLMCAFSVLAGCMPFTNDQLESDPLLRDDDGDGYPEDTLGSGPSDCDDTTKDVSPDADEICDGIDNNCDESVDEGFDADNDGFLDKTLCLNAGGNDCNDKDKSINIEGREICDNKDNDCDGQTDEGFDQDNDGFSVCSAEECDDTDANINADEKEICDDQDNDCDDKIDEGFVDANGTSTCVDDDGDGTTEQQGDCDDEDKNVSPKAKEICDQKDNDCDDSIDEGFDEDSDGFKTCEDDCNDTNDAIFPGATEVCDSVDNDCDEQIDEGFTDADTDGFLNGCGDCDDTNAAIRPGADDICDGLDNDCNGTKDDAFDLDLDGVSTCTGDCNDGNPDVFTGNTERCDLLDNDCDNTIDEGFDADSDGYSLCAADPDCDDTLASVHPGAEEVCDGKDNNCDEVSDEGFDEDSDGFGDCEGQDCDDLSAEVNPGATEICNLVDDDCDTAIDEDFDQDVDGFSLCSAQEDCDDGDPAINPNASEDCFDDVDNNCNGDVDESIDADLDGVSTCGNGIVFDCNDRDKAVYPDAVEVCNNLDNDCSGGSGDYYVTKSGVGDYTSIQTAIASAASTCSIVVDSGIYKEFIDFKGKAVWVRSEDGPDLTFIESTGSAGSMVTFKTSETNKSILEGFTIQKGIGFSVVLTNPIRNGYIGGGIYISNSSPTIRNNIIYSNSATWGGGLYATLSSLTLTSNVFIGNSATEYGSAIFLDNLTNGLIHDNQIEDNATVQSSSKGQATIQVQDCTGTIFSGNIVRNNSTYLVGGLALLGGVQMDVYDNLFEGNSASSSGGAIATGLGDSSSIFDNVFVRNFANQGGAILCSGSDTEPYPSNAIYDNVFTENEGSINGGAMYLTTNCGLDIVNNVFSGNKAGSSAALGGGILVQDAAPYIANNIFYSNLATKGGALAVKGSSTTAIVANNTLYNNAATITGSSIYLTDSTPLVINNLITFSPNGPMLFAESSGFTIQDIRYNNLWGNQSLTNITGLIGTNGNVSADPLFTSATALDFTLQSNSPARNAGDPATTYNDPDGTRNDMGAYGGPFGAW